MNKHSAIYKLTHSILFFIIISCGRDDIVDDVIERFNNGNKRVYVRYHSEPNVLEKHFYNFAGEMILLERDSLYYNDDFKDFMVGTWVLEKITIDEEIMFEKDSVLNLDSLPNIYTFTNDRLIISGPNYFADYEIGYLDSAGIKLSGQWTYGAEGEETYRSERIYDIDYFDILSYYTLVWLDFFEDAEKEEEVVLRRVFIPSIDDQSEQIDSLLIMDSTIVK